MRWIFIFLIFISSVLSAYSQTITPSWTKQGLSSYCHNYEVMDEARRGYWVVSWGSQKESLKESISLIDSAFIETDSSIVFNQDVLSKHELIFNKDNKLYKVVSYHNYDRDFGSDYSKILRERYEGAYGKKSKNSAYGDNGTLYYWEHKNSREWTHTSMSNEIKDVLYYVIIVTSTKEY